MARKMDDHSEFYRKVKECNEVLTVLVEKFVALKRIKKIPLFITPDNDDEFLETVRWALGCYRDSLRTKKEGE